MHVEGEDCAEVELVWGGGGGRGLGVDFDEAAEGVPGGVWGDVST